MFGFGKKKKRNEFIEILSSLGNVSSDEADRFFSSHESLITNSFSRGLDPWGAVVYVAEKSMEKIHAAHHLKDLSLIADIPDYLLLVSLRAIKAQQKANVPSDQLNYNHKYWLQVIELPINPDEPGFTYGDRLEQLVDEFNSKNK